MRGEINLLPKPEQRVRLRRLYLAQLGRFGRRIYFGLAVIVVAQLGVWLAFVLLLGQETGRVSDTAESGQDVQLAVREINELMSAFDGDLREQVVWISRVRDVLELVARIDKNRSKERLANKLLSPRLALLLGPPDGARTSPGEAVASFTNNFHDPTRARYGTCSTV